MEVPAGIWQTLPHSQGHASLKRFLAEHFMDGVRLTRDVSWWFQGC